MVDADAVVALRDGRVVRTLGGVGTGDGAFLDPVALDPTNGLAVFVVDRAGGAVLQFTAEGRLAATLAVPDIDPARPVRQPAAEVGREAARARPTAVAAGRSGRLFVLDGARRHVLRLDPTLGAGQATQGAVEAVLGASGPGALRDPVALAVAADGTLWVADAGPNAVVGFDPFGAFVASIPCDDVGPLVGVAAMGDALLVAGARGLVVVREGRVAERLAVRTDEPIRGAAATAAAVWALTPTRLIGVGRAGRD